MDEEKERADASQEGGQLPVVALGTAAIRVAKELNEQLGGLELYGFSDIRADSDDVESIPELSFPASKPLRFLLYDRAEAGSGTVKAFAAKAKAGGKLFAFEMAAQGGKMQPSWRLGTDVLVRVADEAQCRAAAEALLRMVAPQLLVGLDADDILALFEGTDVVHISIGTAAGTDAQAVTAAVDDALAQLGWKPEFLRGILLSLVGSGDLGMKDVEAATASVMTRVSENCNIVFGAEADPALEGRVRVTFFATCGKRNGSQDASEWMMERLEEQFEDGKNGL